MNKQMNQTHFSQPMLHQFVTGAASGDAITTQALQIQRWLRQMGLQSELYAEHIDPSMQKQVRPLAHYQPQINERYAILHHSLGSQVAPFLQQRPLQLLLIYHNVTPPEFFATASPTWVKLAQQGQQQLHQLRSSTALALADSAFNEQALLAAGYGRTAVLPIALDEADYQFPPNQSSAKQGQIDGPQLLFVGRLAPNKKQEDLVKLLYCVRRIHPKAHLWLVGDRWTVGYDQQVLALAAELGLATAVSLTGKVSQADLVEHYQSADLYISMSEHEGFGKPLIESMYMGLPVLAYACTSVPETMGGAGILFNQKAFEPLAELVDILLKDAPLGQRLRHQQKERAQTFLEPQVQALFYRYLAQLEQTG